MDYRWMNRGSLIKEINDGKLPGSNRIFFRRGTVNALRNGLALSVLSKIDDFEGVMDASRLVKGLKLGKGDYIPFKVSKRGIVFKLRPTNRTELFAKPLKDEHLPEFDFWNEEIPWERCPDNLIEGIAYIENLLHGRKIEETNSNFGIHVDGDYIGTADQCSISRFRLRFPVPFPMILKPVGIRRLASRFKNRRLRRVAHYTIPDMGTGVIFDFGEIRVWNAVALEPDLRNLVPLVNELFNFQIEDIFKLPRGITLAIEAIRLNFQEGRDFKTGRAAITVQIGKTIRLCYGSHVTSTLVSKSRRPSPISFIVNFSAFKALVKEESIMGYGNPVPGKAEGKLYLRNQQVEHAIPINFINNK